MAIPRQSTKPYHFTRYGETGFEFDPRATEVAILDRSGRAIWKKSKGELPSPIRWTGDTTAGHTIQTGDYICKIVYPDAQVTYLPFVFVKRK